MQETPRLPGAAELRTMTARFAPVEVRADVSALSGNDRRALAKLVDAAHLMGALFLRQVWSGNESLLQDLSRSARARLPRNDDRPS